MQIDANTQGVGGWRSISHTLAIVIQSCNLYKLRPTVTGMQTQ